MLLKAKALSAALLGIGLLTVPFVASTSSAAQTVVEESHLGVSNSNTDPSSTYTKSTSANVDQTVTIALYYHNTENPDSGKVANDVKAQINIPASQGTVQTVSSSVSGSNFATVNDTATVNLSLDRAYLEYIPGSAEWKHNVGTNANLQYKTEKISDDVVKGGVNLGSQQPCYNFESWVTVQARVKASVVGITKTVKNLNVDGSKYVPENDAKPGDELGYAIVIKNYGNTTLNKVVVGDNLPPYLTYEKGSTKLVDSNTGVAGRILADGITEGGIYVDSMAPGAAETIYIRAKLATTIPAGNHVLKNVGIVKPEGLTEVYNVATTNVKVAAISTPKPTPVVTPSVTPKPSVTPTPAPVLPDTGAEGALAGAAGIGSIGYAARAYLRSRKSLTDTLRRK